MVQSVRKWLPFGGLGCDRPGVPERFNIVKEAPLLWRRILEQPEVDGLHRIPRHTWLQFNDLRKFTFVSEQLCPDGA